ncbi:MAG: hypothetical protein ACQSGP_05875 [Frankia sp.]
MLLRIAIPVISGLSLVVSVLVAWDSRRQIRRAERIKLAAYADELNQVQVEWEKLLLDRESVPSSLGVAFNERRELLASQAKKLVSTYRKDVSSREYGTLAWAYRLLNDSESARAMYTNAIRAADLEGPAYAAASERTFGEFLCYLGAAADGREHFRRSVDLTSGTDNLALYFRAETLMMWARVEHEIDPAGVARACSLD